MPGRPAAAGRPRADRGDAPPCRPDRRGRGATRSVAHSDVRCRASPKPTLPATSMWGNNAPFWNTRPTRRASGGTCVARPDVAPDTSRPPIRTSPASSSSRPGHDPQERRLAAARRTQQRDHLTVADAEVDAVQDPSRTERLRDPRHDDIAQGRLGLRARATCSAACSGRSVGKSTTSRMDVVSVSSMTSRSMPMPSPTVGGRPYSSARR